MDIEKHTIFLARVGSHSYGTNIEGSDIDLRGCLIAPMRSYCDPYFTFEQHEEAVAKGFATDKVVYDIKKFIKLAAQANPNSLEPLFVESRFIETMTTEGQTLINNRNLFISQEFKSRIFGFANREMAELGRGIEKVQRDPIEHFNGSLKVLNDEEIHDALAKFHKKQGKRALHIKRLLNMLYDFYEKETIIVFRPEAAEINKERTKDWLGYSAFNDLCHFFKHRELDINELVAKSHIPLTPDYKKISELCYTLIDDHQYNLTQEAFVRITGPQ